MKESQHPPSLSPGQSWLPAEGQRGEITLDDGPAVGLDLQQPGQSLQAGVITGNQDLQPGGRGGREVAAPGSCQHVVVGVDVVI